MTRHDDSKWLLPPKNMQRRTLLASLNCDGRLGLALVATLAVPWLLWAGGPHWAAELRYERAGLQHGEWWRLLSAHWVHLNARHLLLDSAGLALLWALYARELPPMVWMLIALAAAATIDAGLWWEQPEVQWYAGLSGLLHGAWAAGAAAAAFRQGRWAWLMLALLMLKLALEQRSGASLVTSAFPVITIAHLYGALGGLGGYAIAAARLRNPL